jgi:nucleoside-diphosphate-sugar epimerase
MKIAIFGASGHIGKNLIYYLKDDPHLKIFCFSRSIEKINGFILSVNAENCVPTTYDEFSGERYDAIINCIGIGDPAALKIAKDQIFRLTEYYDNLILDNLKIYQSTVYINISSGAVYGTDFRNPADNSFITEIDVNKITTIEHYRIAKLNSEVKHRSLSDFKIIDLRIFGFFSRFIELNKEFLLCKIIKSVLEEKIFITGIDNIYRDYIHPQDFVEIIKKCISNNEINKAFDVISKAPISKFEILDFFKTNYHLKIEIDPNTGFNSITGNKLNYYSTNNNILLELGFEPSNGSLDTIKMESEIILNHSLKS